MSAESKMLSAAEFADARKVVEKALVHFGRVGHASLATSAMDAMVRIAADTAARANATERDHESMRETFKVAAAQAEEIARLTAAHEAEVKELCAVNHGLLDGNLQISPKLARLTTQEAALKALFEDGWDDDDDLVGVVDAALRNLASAEETINDDAATIAGLRAQLDGVKLPRKRLVAARALVAESSGESPRDAEYVAWLGAIIALGPAVPPEER